MSYKEKQMQYR